MRRPRSLRIRSSRTTVSSGLFGCASLLFVAAYGGLTHAAGVPAARANDPQRLVFLLEYVGTDYDTAVRDGHIKLSAGRKRHVLVRPA